MDKPLFTLIDMSISGGILILAAIAVRALFRKGPKWIPLVLWALVGARLILPFFPESGLSVIPRMGEVFAQPETIVALPDTAAAPSEPVSTLPEVFPTAYAAKPTAEAHPLDTARPTEAAADTEVPASTPAPSMAASPTASAAAVLPAQTLAPYSTAEPSDRPAAGFAARTDGGFPWTTAAFAIWLGGAAVMLLYAAAAWLRLKKRLRTAVRRSDGVYCTEQIEIPFLFGLVRPGVYLPFGVEGEDYDNIMMHEKAHVARADHVKKLIGFLILSLHWFNPLCWLAFALFSRDLELACDERVIMGMSSEKRASYSRTVLAFSTRRRGISACRLSFGEADAAARIKAVAEYKRPRPIVTAAALCAIVLAASLSLFCTGSDTPQPTQEAVTPTEEPTAAPAATDAPAPTADPSAPKTEFGVPIRDGEDPARFPRTEDYGVLPDEYRNIVAGNVFNGATAYRDSLVKYYRVYGTWEWGFERYDFSGNTTAKCRIKLSMDSAPRGVYPTSDGGLLVTWGKMQSEEDLRKAKAVKFSKAGSVQWEYIIPDGIADTADYCFEFDGAYYLFGNYPAADPEDATEDELGLNWDIYMLKLGKNGEPIKERRFGGSRYDYLYGVYLTDKGFMLDLRSRSWDGDFEGFQEEGRQFEGRAEVNGDLDVTSLIQKQFDYRKYEGYIDGKPVFGTDRDAVIDLGDHYLSVSKNVTGIYPEQSFLLSSMRYYVETVYTDRAKDGTLLWRRAIDCTPDYGIIGSEHLPSQIYFTSAGIEQAVRDRIPGIGEDEGIETSAAAQIENICLGGADLTDLSDLVYLSGLKSLSICDAENVDLSTLPTLPELTELTVTGCGIEDVSFVLGFPAIERLILADNRITDLVPLTALDKLVLLDVSNNRVSDVMPIAGISSLTDADISWNPVSEESLKALKDQLLKRAIVSSSLAKAVTLVNYTEDRSVMACWPMDLDGDGKDEYFYARLDWMVGDIASYVWLENGEGNRLGDMLLCGRGSVAFGTYAIVETPEFGACILRIAPEYENQNYGYELYDLKDGRLTCVLTRVYSESFYSYDDEGENKYDPAEAAEYEARLNKLLKSGHILVTTDRWGVMKGELYRMDTDAPVEVDPAETLGVVCTVGSAGPGMKAMRDKYSRNLLFVDGKLGYNLKVRPYTGE